MNKFKSQIKSTFGMKGSGSINELSLVEISFRLRKPEETFPNETIHICGSLLEFGRNSMEKSPSMKKDLEGIWTYTLNITLGTLEKKRRELLNTFEGNAHGYFFTFNYIASTFEHGRHTIKYEEIPKRGLERTYFFKESSYQKATQSTSSDIDLCRYRIVLEHEWSVNDHDTVVATKPDIPIPDTVKIQSVLDHNHNHWGHRSSQDVEKEKDVKAGDNDVNVGKVFRTENLEKSVTQDEDKIKDKEEDEDEEEEDLDNDIEEKLQKVKSEDLTDSLDGILEDLENIESSEVSNERIYNQVNNITRNQSKEQYNKIKEQNSEDIRKDISEIENDIERVSEKQITREKSKISEDSEKIDRSMNQLTLTPRTRKRAELSKHVNFNEIPSRSTSTSSSSEIEVGYRHTRDDKEEDEYEVIGDEISNKKIRKSYGSYDIKSMGEDPEAKVPVGYDHMKVYETHKFPIHKDNKPLSKEEEQKKKKSHMCDENLINLSAGQGALFLHVTKKRPLFS